MVKIWGKMMEIAIIAFIIVIAVLLKDNQKNKKTATLNVPIQDKQIKEDEGWEISNVKSQYKKKFLLTINEKSQYWKLKEVTDNLGLLLFAKVRMIDVVEPIKKDYTYLNKIIRKHLDFVILNSKGYTVCAIEIDDNSHKKEEQNKSDNIKNSILEDVGIPLIRTNGINKVEIEKRLLFLTQKDTV